MPVQPPAGYGKFATDGPADGNDYARAARTPDGRLAIIYAPMIRPLSIDPSGRARHCAVVRPGQRRLQRDRRVTVRQHGYPEFQTPGE